jgi:hypothetical protein
MEVGGQRHATAALPPGKTRYPLYRRLGGLQGRSGRVWKISTLLGFDPRTAQPVASHYTEYAILDQRVYRNGKYSTLSAHGLTVSSLENS